MVNSFNDFNQKIMDEFHQNGGKVGGPFAGADVLILTSTGDGDRFVIVASKGGAPTSPDWFHNLAANPSAVIEVGSDVIPVEASVATGAERDRLYAQHASRMPQFNEYAKKTTREIPVVVLARKP